MVKFIITITISLLLLSCSNNTDITKINNSILTPLQELLVGEWFWDYRGNFSDLEFTDDYTFEATSYNSNDVYRGTFQFANDSILKLTYYITQHGEDITLEEKYKVNKLDKEILILNSDLTYHRQ